MRVSACLIVNCHCGVLTTHLSVVPPVSREDTDLHAVVDFAELPLAAVGLPRAASRDLRSTSRAVWKGTGSARTCPIAGYPVHGSAVVHVVTGQLARMVVVACRLLVRKMRMRGSAHRAWRSVDWEAHQCTATRLGEDLFLSVRMKQIAWTADDSRALHVVPACSADMQWIRASLAAAAAGDGGGAMQTG